MVRLFRVAFLLMVAMATPAGADDLPLYRPKGYEAWDFWFAKSGDTYYGFYLQAPDGSGLSKYGQETIGLATSKDLFHWKEVGEVLRANPKGQWCDHHLATGSVWRHQQKWLMLFTASGNGDGLGVAESDDLTAWKMIGPVQLNYQSHVVPEHPYWQSQGLKAGEQVRYEVLADPYVLPDPIEGWQYMIANCGIVGRPVNSRGCVGLMRTKDGRAWDDCGIIALMLDYDRPETSQIWPHGDRWYLYFGGAREGQDGCRHNRIYSSGSMTGPYEPLPNSVLTLPDGQPFYIAKVIADPAGHDVLLGCQHAAMLTRPYPVQYGADGSISLAFPAGH